MLEYLLCVVFRFVADLWNVDITLVRRLVMQVSVALVQGLAKGHVHVGKQVNIYQNVKKKSQALGMT